VPSPLGTLLNFHSSSLVTVANTSTLWNALAALTPHRAAAAPTKPLDDLEAIDLVKDKPLEASVTLEQQREALGLCQVVKQAPEHGDEEG
jgi:hypothetical protein